MKQHQGVDQRTLTEVMSNVVKAAPRLKGGALYKVICLCRKHVNVQYQLEKKFTCFEGNVRGNIV